MRIGLLPAAGTATRMNGLPKFLLPISEQQQCLLDYHVALMAPHVDRIIIPTRSEWVSLLHSFEFGPQVEVTAMATRTMAETVKRSLDCVDYDTCVLGMPDTYFVGGNPYQELAQEPQADVSLKVFTTRPEQAGRVGSVLVGPHHVVSDHADKEPERDFGAHWGVIEFSREVEAFLSPEATTGGYLISEALDRGMDVRGYLAGYPYFDCGTFAEYVQCLTFLSLPADEVVTP
jgi:CTP:molybdopterin cytidylyltransferase MocA